MSQLTPYTPSNGAQAPAYNSSRLLGLGDPPHAPNFTSRMPVDGHRPATAAYMQPRSHSGHDGHAFQSSSVADTRSTSRMPYFGDIGRGRSRSRSPHQTPPHRLEPRYSHSYAVRDTGRSRSRSRSPAHTSSRAHAQILGADGLPPQQSQQQEYRPQFNEYDGDPAPPSPSHAHDWSNPPPNTSSVLPPTARAEVLPVKYVDAIARQNELDEPRTKRLHDLLTTASIGTPLLRTDLSVRIMEFALSLRLDQQLGTLLKTSGSNVQDQINTIAAAVKTQWQVPADLKIALKAYTHKIGYASTRMQWATIATEVFEHFRQDKDGFKLAEIIKIASKKGILKAACNAEGRMLREQLKRDFCSGLLGETFKSIEEFTIYCNQKYRGKATSDVMDPKYLHRNLIIRNLIVQNPIFLVKKSRRAQVPEDQEEDSHDADENNENNEPQSAVPPASDSVMAKAETKAPDFWVTISSLLQAEMKKYGDTFDDPRWQVRLEELKKIEASGFSKGVLNAVVQASGGGAESVQSNAMSNDNPLDYLN